MERCFVNFSVRGFPLEGLSVCPLEGLSVLFFKLHFFSFSAGGICLEAFFAGIVAVACRVFHGSS